MYLVDTHQHLWDLAQFPYSWCADIPTLNRSFRLPDYRAASTGLGIQKTIFMECDVDEPHALAEAQHVQRLAEQHPEIVGIVASARPERPDFPQQVEQLRALTKLRGLRRILHTQPDELSQTPLFAENLRRLPAWGLTFDLCVLARQHPLAIDLIDRCPDVRFVLDHCGVPDVKGRAFEPWKTSIAAIAERRNVTCKISGLVAYADPSTWTTADLRPWVEHVIACFGWDRVVWGSDWPVCTLSATLAQWVEATHELMSGVSADERARLYHRNAEALYRV
ncbi:MAG TPA: amidohydrolase [Candidatus Synoicihabitans sp.]|nr:amidohydrolase [Candidatus Synoicihabitans sp.]